MAKSELVVDVTLSWEDRALLTDLLQELRRFRMRPLYAPATAPYPQYPQVWCSVSTPADPSVQVWNEEGT